MNWRLAFKIGPMFLALGVVLFWTTSPVQESHPPHWSYAGEQGPGQWGQLDPAYATCAAGRAQSPIDIQHPKLADLPPLKFDYKPVTLNIINNGHTIQVSYPPGSNLTV